MVWKIKGLKECLSAWHLLLLGSPPAVMSRSTLPSSSTCASQTLTKTSMFSCAILLTGWAASVLAAWITLKEKLDILLNYNVYTSFLIPSLSHHHKHMISTILNSTSSSSSSSLSTPSQSPSSSTSWSLPSFSFSSLSFRVNKVVTSCQWISIWSHTSTYFAMISLKLAATDIGNPYNHCHHHHQFLPFS